MSDIKKEAAEEYAPQLAASLQALKQDLVQLKAPEQVELDLLRAFDQQFPKRPWWQKWDVLQAKPQWRVVGGLAISMFAVFFLVKGAMSPLTEDVAHDNAMAQADVDLYEDIPFVALDSGEEILQQDRMRIVRMDVPHTMLAPWA